MTALSVTIRAQRGLEKMSKLSKTVVSLTIFLLLAGTAHAYQQLEGGVVSWVTTAENTNTENYGPPQQYTAPAPPPTGNYGPPQQYTAPAPPPTGNYGPPQQYTAPAPPSTGNYGPPPQYAVPAPPSVVVIPGTYVYVVPDSRVPILFYHGSWWRPFEGRWYRSNYYNGPWFYVRRRGVPRVLITMPPDYYYSIPPGSPWIPYVELRDNWERWERERHWDRHEERRDEHRERHFDYR